MDENTVEHLPNLILIMSVNLEVLSGHWYDVLLIVYFLSQILMPAIIMVFLFISGYLCEIKLD